MTLGIARRLAKAINEEGSPLQPLATPTCRNLWLSYSVSNLVTIVKAVGAGWRITTCRGQASMVALVQTATTLPIMLLSLAASALADNFVRHTVMLIAQNFVFTVS